MISVVVFLFKIKGVVYFRIFYGERVLMACFSNPTTDIFGDRPITHLRENG